MSRWILVAGGTLAAVAVLVGAFATHALKPTLGLKAMGWIDTGVFYHFVHALGLLVCGLLPGSRAVSLSAMLFIAGIIMFSGSLYLMALTGFSGFALVTPFGGLCFIAAWVSFCRSVWLLDRSP